MTLRQWRAFDRFSASASNPCKKNVKFNIDGDLLFSVVWLYIIGILLGVSVLYALLLNHKPF